ncbi:hypothetical protein NQ317_006510 [Molorchus minor]|uniref:Uncharacterized protein n=1 Tax=Molorchus minor TaxID=1323400 RepID=A0ABQ9ISX8_9CUCU|nr:hypothetical protein NQ317_006510 [Molorchus minor]
MSDNLDVNSKNHMSENRSSQNPKTDLNKNKTHEIPDESISISRNCSPDFVNSKDDNSIECSLVGNSAFDAQNCESGSETEPDQQVKEQQASLILLKHEKKDREQQIKTLEQELQRLQSKQKDVLQENNDLSFKGSTTGERKTGV